jgi:hypothetical protein
MIIGRHSTSTCTPTFPVYLVRTGFRQYIHTRLHLSDPDEELERGQPGYNKLQKVEPLVTILKQKFNEMYHLSREITVDEAMIPFKGRLGYKQ